MVKSIIWLKKSLKIIDQTKIPERLEYLELKNEEEVFDAIRQLKVRGAPAIGVAAAFGLFLGLRKRKFSDKTDFVRKAETLRDYLCNARPTAVNLAWSLQTIIDQIKTSEGTASALLDEVLAAALSIQQDDERYCKLIGEYGAKLISNGMNILTHCNTGILATAGIGTALGIIYTANKQGKNIHVWVDETRPLLQGARLTMWELRQSEIPATLIPDSAAAYAMQKGQVDLVLVGADRIAANGDVANKIGTYSLAINCHRHHIPFYVAAPLSTFDPSLSSGSEIPIEERDKEEITKIWNQLNITVESADAWNPAFDVTPAELISGIVTEEGILHPPFENSFQNLKFF